jgi:site-specific DNA-cytosine methylase
MRLDDGFGRAPTALADKVFTVLFPFCGVGGAALGFQGSGAEFRKLGVRARFQVLGGIEMDPSTARDFTRLTGAPCLTMDVRAVTPAMLRAEFGETCPDVIFFSPPCLPGHGEVLTPEGPRRIDAMRANDLVLTHRGRYRRVRAVGAHMFTGTMLGFRLHGTVDVQEFTPEHPLWVRRTTRPMTNGRVRGLGEPKFLPAGEVRVGDRVGFPIDPVEPGCARRFIASLGDPTVVRRGGKNEGPYTKSAHDARLVQIHDLTPFAESPALWFLIGAYLGDGYRRPSRYELAYCVGASGGDLDRAIRKALAVLGLHSVKEDADSGSRNVKLRLHARHLSMICGAFGDGAADKRIPPALMGLERPLLDALIEGYRATDGSERATYTAASGRLASANWSIVSIALPLLRDMQRLLLRRGEFGAIHVASHGGPSIIEGRAVQTRPRWEIVVAETTRRGTHEFLDGAVWVRVRSKTERPTTERVWNLEVEEDDTFCAPMMATHNCKGGSGLLSKALAKTAKYTDMNGLCMAWLALMFDTWPEGPLLLLMENVPNLRNRARSMFVAVRRLLASKGYVSHDEAHDCGVMAGLAQHRKRLLLVARHAARVPALLYQPAPHRVRAVSEVLGHLPLPHDPAGGPLHRLPEIDPLTALRLALIPAGKDWKALPSRVLVPEELATRLARVRPSARTPFNDVWRVMHYASTAPCVTSGATPSSGGTSVADPRAGYAHAPRDHDHGVMDWCATAGTITTRTDASNGRFSVADPRAGYDHEPRNDDHGVLGWCSSSGTITGKARPGNGRFSVADPRATSVDPQLHLGPQAHANLCGVTAWSAPGRTVTGASRPASGALSVADPRASCGFNGTYGVLPWSDPTGALPGAAAQSPATGRFTVADPRPSVSCYPHTYGVLRPSDAAHTITATTYVGCGPFSLADARVTHAVPGDPDAWGVAPLPQGSLSVSPAWLASLPFPFILAADGTWHRPLTTYECAMLQSFPEQVDGRPFDLEGTREQVRVKVGDAVPRLTGTRIGDQCLYTLIDALYATWTPSAGGVWVRPSTDEPDAVRMLDA